MEENIKDFFCFSVLKRKGFLNGDDGAGGIFFGVQVSAFGILNCGRFARTITNNHVE